MRSEAYINNKKKSEISSIKISVIIPFHGDIIDLRNCLEGLQKQNCNILFEVIVVESGNHNEIKNLLELNPNVTFISFDYIIFPGRARNIGVAKSKSNLLAFIDGDCVPATTWISEMYSALKIGNEIVIGPIGNLYPFHPIASVDNLLLFPDFQKRPSSTKVKYFPACNFGITKTLFLRTGGFSEDIRIGEDTKFSECALKLCNSKISYNQKVKVRHSGRKNIKQFMKHHELFGYYREYLNPKNYNRKNMFRRSILYAALFGFRRLVYISIRTLQWNPIGFLRVIFYSPFLIFGLSAWIKGFWKKNQKLFKGRD